jgi:hypothetical protein
MLIHEKSKPVEVKAKQMKIFHYKTNKKATRIEIHIQNLIQTQNQKHYHMHNHRTNWNIDFYKIRLTTQECLADLGS